MRNSLSVSRCVKKENSEFFFFNVKESKVEQGTSDELKRQIAKFDPICNAQTVYMTQKNANKNTPSANKVLKFF